MYVKWSQDRYTWGKLKRKKKIHNNLTTSLINKNTPPNYLSPILTLPLSTRLLSYLKLLPLFVTNNKGQVSQAVITSSSEELASSSSSSSLSSLLESPSSSTSSDASSEGGGDATKPPRRACRQAIWSTRVFTWHNSSLSVSRWASTRWNCTITTSRVTPPADEEGANVEGAEEVGGVTVSIRGCFGQS